MPELRYGLIVLYTGAVLTPLSTIVVGARLFARQFMSRNISVSDILIFIALCFTWGNFVVNYYMDKSSNGISPEWYLDAAKRPMLLSQVRKTLISWWVYRFSYNLALSFVKLSILFFYRTITAHHTSRRLVNFTIGLVSLYTISAVVAAIFQCNHPQDAWDPVSFLASFDPKDPAGKVHKCYDPIGLFIVSTSMNLLTDVITLVLPIPTLWTLRLPTNKRIGLVGIFSIGMLAVIASTVRVYFMALWAQSPWNSAIYGAKLLLWGQIETNVGIICASIPFLRIFFRKKQKVTHSSMNDVKFSPTKSSTWTRMTDIDSPISNLHSTHSRDGDRV